MVVQSAASLRIYASSFATLAFGSTILKAFVVASIVGYTGQFSYGAKAENEN